jgi:hypothetical protein
LVESGDKREILEDCSFSFKILRQKKTQHENKARITKFYTCQSSVLLLDIGGDREG